MPSFLFKRTIRKADFESAGSPICNRQASAAPTGRVRFSRLRAHETPVSPRRPLLPVGASSFALALVLMASAGLGCSPKTAKAKLPELRSTPTAATGPAWKWESYPEMRRMRVATLPCQLQPKSAITVISPTAGMLRVYVHSPQAELPADYLWAEFEPEIFAQEEQTLREQLKRLEDLEQLQWQIEYPRKKMELEDRVEAAERDLKTLQLLATKTNLSTFSVGTNLNTIRPQAIAKAEENFRLLEQSLAYVESTNYAALGFDPTGQRTDFKRRQLEFEQRRRQSRFEMPFRGKLTFSLPISEGVTNCRVNLGQEIAVARDVSLVRVRVAMENIAWTGISPEKLQAVVRSAGQLFMAQFAYQKIEKVQNREEAAYYFEFPPDKAAATARLIGANVTCELWTDLPEPARIVPKLAMVLHRPDAFQNRDWGAAIGSTFPGARLLIEGQTDLAVVLPRPIQVTSAK
jgi:hypothetical protein